MTRTLNISLVTLGDPDTPTGGYLYHRRIADLAPQFDARVDFISFPTRPFPLPALVATRLLRQAGDSDAVLIDSIAAAFVAPALLTDPPAVPLFGILHQPPGGIDHGLVRTKLQAALDRSTYRRLRLLFAASEPLAHELRAQGFDKVVLMPPGRDVAAIQDVPLEDLRHGKHAAFLCVGNWVERKGIHDLLEAFARLPADNGMLHLVGDVEAQPSYAARIRKRLAEPDLVDRALVHGHVPKERVAALYRNADVFVLPSYKEPYGTVYGEAMASGLPVVGWAAGNLPFLISDGVEGFALPPGDVDALSLALRRLAEDDELRARMSDAARGAGEKLPTWEQTAQNLFLGIKWFKD